MSKQDPAWLVSKVDQRLALMKHLMGPLFDTYVKNFNVIMTTLTEAEGDSDEAFERWNNTCDNCGKVDPGLHMDHYEGEWKGVKVVVIYGACDNCIGPAHHG